MRSLLVDHAKANSRIRALEIVEQLSEGRADRSPRRGHAYRTEADLESSRASGDCRGDDRIDVRQMRRDATPVASLVRTHPDLAAGGAEIHPGGIAVVGAKRLSLDGEPRVLARQPAILPNPRRARVARPYTAGRPPNSCVAIPRCRPSGIPTPSRDRADAARCRSRCRRSPSACCCRSESTVAGPIDSIDAAVILLVETIRFQWMQAHAMHVLSILGIRIRQEVRLDALD